jgi:predicted ABC-type ATPase
VRLDLVVGPNGAGKSTFVRLTLAPTRPGVGVVNADVIAAQRWPDDPEGHSYEAARIAEATRTALIEQRQPLIAESVFSHPSKLDLLRRSAAAGYYTALHVLMVPEELAVARVAARVAAGGHAVPEDKVRGRYRRLWPLVADAVVLADAATVYDNAQRAGPRAVAVFSHGFPVGNPSWPGWAPDPLSRRWPSDGEPADRGSRGRP